MLDKSKPYTKIIGCNRIGARYHQNGKAFNAKEQEIAWGTGEVIEPKSKPRAKPRAKSKAKPVDDDLIEQLATEVKEQAEIKDQ